MQVLIERYRGRIWVEDRIPGRPKEGAAFRFTLPKAGDGGPGVRVDETVPGCEVGSE